MKHTRIKNIFAGVLLSSMVAGLVFSAETVQAQGSQTGFKVTQKVRNLTKQNFAWMDSLGADAGDRIEFQITVTWQGSQATHNVFVREGLSDKLVYVNNLKLDGLPQGGDIAKENINIGTIGGGQSKTVSFEAQVAALELLPVGTSNLINTATVFNTDGSASTTAMVQATKAGSPTDVSTGPLSVWMIWLAFLFMAALFMGSFLLLRSYLRREVFESPYATRTDRKLAVMIGSIKQKEKRS